MNGRDHTDPEPRPALQTLDLAALGGGDPALVCDIDDPDCEAPAATTVEGASTPRGMPDPAEDGDER